MEIPGLVRSVVARMPLVGWSSTSRSEPAAWRLRPGGDDDLAARMVELSVVAMGTAEVGDLTDLPSPDALRASLAAARPDRSATATARAMGSWRAFRSGIATGDVVVVVRRGRRVAIAEVVGDYEYRPKERDERLRHVRPVRWLSTELSADQLPDDIRRSIGAPGLLGRVTPPNAAARLSAAA
jgi:restriction system protein